MNEEIERPRANNTDSSLLAGRACILTLTTSAAAVVGRFAPSGVSGCRAIRHAASPDIVRWPSPAWPEPWRTQSSVFLSWFHFLLCYFQLSLRKQEAGKPSWFMRFGSASCRQPNLTATGLGTASLQTSTLLPSISALASTNFLSSPAMVK